MTSDHILSPPLPPQLYRMHRHISLLQLQRHVGLHEVPLQQKQELVAMCLHHFRAGLRLGVEFRDTSCQPADYYIILAAHIKIELYHETGSYKREGVCGVGNILQLGWFSYGY